MLNLKLYLILFLFFVFFFLPHSVLAQNHVVQTTTLESNQTTSGDYFAANSNINLEGTVSGDAYLAGGNINVDGVVNGDLLIAGGNVNIKGKILGNVRGVGGQVSIAGEIGKNVSVAGGNISLVSGSRVEGNLTAAGGNLSISSNIGGAVNAAAGQVSLSNGATVKKDLTYWSNSSVQINPQATVSGKITQHIPPKRTSPNPVVVLKKAFILFTVFSLLTSLIIGALFIKFLPNFSQRVTGIIIQKPFPSFLTGLLTIILLPIISIVLFIIVIGIPLAVILIIAMVIFFFLARIFAAIYIGERILKLVSKNISPYWSLLLGLIILGILMYIPFIGMLAALVLGLMGIGAVLIEKKNLYADLRSKKLI